MFIAVEQGRSLSASDLPGEAAISVVTLAELELGVQLASSEALRARRLATLMDARSAYAPLPIDERVASAFAELVSAARRAGHRPGVQDAWLGATARAHEIPLFTQDRGFDVFEGLKVVHV